MIRLPAAVAVATGLALAGCVVVLGLPLEPPHAFQAASPGETRQAPPAQAVESPVPRLGDSAPAAQRPRIRPAVATRHDLADGLVRLVGDTEGVRSITFETLSFDIKPDAAYEPKMLTDDIRKLVGKRVEIRGWIEESSIFRTDGIREFIFVRHNLDCCFGPGAPIYDCMQVNLAPGQTTRFTVRPITIEGTFDIDPIEDEDRLWVLYRLKDAKVK